MFTAESYERRRPGFSTELCASWRRSIWPSSSCVPLHSGPSGGKEGSRLPADGWPTSQTHTPEPRPLPLRWVDWSLVEGALDQIVSFWSLTMSLVSFSCLFAPSSPHPFHVVVELFVMCRCHWWFRDYRCRCCRRRGASHCDPNIAVLWHTIMMLCWCHHCGCACCPHGGRGHTEEERSGTRKPASQWKVSDLDIVLSEPIEKWDSRSPLLEGDSKESEFLNGASQAYSQHTALVID